MSKIRVVRIKPIEKKNPGEYNLKIRLWECRGKKKFNQIFIN